MCEVCLPFMDILVPPSYSIIPLHISPSLHYNPYCHTDWSLVSLR